MFNKIVIPFIAGGIALTAGCGSGNEPDRPNPFNVSTVEKAQEAPCDKAQDAASEVTSINDATNSQKRRDGLNAWSIDPESTKDEVQKLIDALETRAKSEACTSGSGEDATPVSDPEPQAKTAKTNGEVADLPFVEGGPRVDVDSTSDPRTPPVVADVKMAKVKDWGELYDLMKDEQWYIDGINARKAETGWDWDDVKTWANARTRDGEVADARVIKVFNLSEAQVSDDEARAIVKKALGNDKAFDTMRVERHSCFINTRGLERKQMSDFIDCKQQVRVALVPLVLNADGSVRGRQINATSWVFVDCLNLGRLYYEMARPGKPLVCPPGTPNAGQPMTSIIGCYPPGKKPECKPGNCPPPTEKCPPGNTNPDCAPKSGNAADYQVPAGKPRVGQPDTPVEGHANDPAQNVPGGGGVVDNPNNDSGSETGGTAPGASPPPSTPSPPPTGDGEDEENEPPITQPDW
jgi:hypothetical protein